MLTALVTAQPVEVIEQSLGRLEAPRIPAVAAETTGQVRSISVDAGDRVEQGVILAVLDDEAQRLAVESARATVARLEVLLENQERTVQRLQQLSREQSVAQSMLDDAVAQARALRAQVTEATARARESERALAKARVESPITGIVQAKLVSVGDFVTPGQAMFEVVAHDRLRAYLPFPETLAGRIRAGQAVELTLPTLDTAPVRANVNEIRPMVGTGSSAIEAIVELENPGNWMPGASVRGRVVVERRDDGLVVPEAAVIQRPAGDVVYVVTDGIAHQRSVRTGVRRDGWAEIIDGLAAGETVATEGAGFLTDGTAVRARDSAPD
ncbi:MAG: efflux RND transporter periplasmic adaptor subunit [Pseudomonadales bacterium]|nr:efflux RND transporter periplasmic adaptor subunit [Pseudomonadales bacterium]